MIATVFDSRISTLGEGAFWHPVRKQFFWFDILGSKLHTRTNAGGHSWDLGEFGSAAGWVDENTLLILTETGLYRFDIETGSRELVVSIEADNPVTRSNDGRADPWGGFWASTIGKKLEQGAGAIYRLYKGELRKLFSGITIPNDICFSVDRGFAYFADTDKCQIMRVALSADDGWPVSEPELFIDLEPDALKPDGAIIDADGQLWVAQWGASRVAVYDTNGNFVRAVTLSAPQVTCPAFGGDDLTTLYITTAREGISDADAAKFPESGMVFHAPGAGRGRPESKVLL